MLSPHGVGSVKPAHWELGEEGKLILCSGGCHAVVFSLANLEDCTVKLS